MLRTAKYPLSDASAESGRPPSAKTCTHESAASGSERSSPALRAMSAINRSMMIVETGSSMGSVAKPKAPPAAPEAVTKALWKSCDPARGGWCMVRSAAGSAISSALEVAVVIACEADAGSAYPISSIGLPTMLASRAAKPGCSSKATALRSAARSFSVMPAKSNTGCAPHRPASARLAAASLVSIAWYPENQEHDPPRRVTDPRYPFKHRSLAHGLAVVAWSPTVSTVMLDVRSDRAPGWTAGNRSLHRGDLYLTHMDAGAPPTAKRPL